MIDVQVQPEFYGYRNTNAHYYKIMFRKRKSPQAVKLGGFYFAYFFAAGVAAGFVAGVGSASGSGNCWLACF